MDSMPEEPPNLVACTAGGAGVYSWDWILRVLGQRGWVFTTKGEGILTWGSQDTGFHTMRKMPGDNTDSLL